MDQVETMEAGNGALAESLINTQTQDIGRISEPVKQIASGADAKVLVHLFRMADNYRASNSTNSAIEMYFMFFNEHPETIQAEMARERLLEIAVNYEQNGKSRQARGIYERLL